MAGKGADMGRISAIAVEGGLFCGKMRDFVFTRARARIRVQEAAKFQRIKVRGWA